MVRDKGLEDLKDWFYYHYPSREERGIVENAYRYAVEAHSGQKRVSGEMYITHPLGVAKILTELEMDPVTVVAGILHDVVEDTDVTIENIENDFSPEVALLVDGVTKLSKLEFKTKEEQRAETLRKMFLAMAKDIRVVLIKLADRTHNLRTLRHLETKKRREIARETLDIYAPLAHRLGIYKIKGELEDLAFRYLQEEEYYNLVDKLAKKKTEREEFINQAIKALREYLQRVNISAEIQGRPKHLYSIYTKIKEQNLDLSEVYDLTAIRIILDSVKDCYGALGVVHTLWKPIPGRFKDYIAMPKPNMYQSLHTTVVGTESEFIEIQIRTWDMHRTAEYGIAAHWSYKEKSGSEEEFADKLAWLRQLMEWQQDSRDALEFMENIKMDLFTDEVFVFTPRGDVIDLPAGAIPIDFAYRIHTDVGNCCVGCRVNGRLVPLDYKLINGDIIEIITGKKASPSRDWLKIVSTSAAKSRIRAWFKKERREENIEKGKDLVERELKRMKVEPRALMKNEYILEVGKRVNILNGEELYAAVGYGGVSAKQVGTRLLEEYKARKEVNREEETDYLEKIIKKPSQSTMGIKVYGLDNILIRFARCCNPLPGDDIMGVITMGRGVSVHREDCNNIRDGNMPVDRLVEVEWDAAEEVVYHVEIVVSATDRPRLLSDIVTSVSEVRVDIAAVQGKSEKDNVARIYLTIMVNNQEHLMSVMKNIKKVEDVFDVQRCAK